ncbi:hypothetical protein BH09MYX1_BH09MYX1_46560 [soil metagenome]
MRLALAVTWVTFLAACDSPQPATPPTATTASPPASTESPATASAAAPPPVASAPAPTASACPTCDGRMKLRAVVTDPKSVAGFLRALGELDDVPGRAPSRGPPYGRSTVLRRRALGHAA